MKDFEFDALEQASNYRQALEDEFGPYLQGEVVEVGAGIGHMTEHLLRRPGVSRAVSVEPDQSYCARLRVRFPGLELVEGTAADLPPNSQWDAVLSINVLEHIQDDEAELTRYAHLLARRRGALCLFVPAGPEIFAPIDRDFGHFRRYKRAELKNKLTAAGFEILRLDYFNFTGYFAWWLDFRLLKKRHFDRRKVRLYDRLIFPAVHALESKIVRPPFGQSLMAVGRSNPK